MNHELASVTEFAAVYGIPRGTLYRWAEEDDWHKHGTTYRRLYPIEQMLTSLQERDRDAKP